MYNLWKTDDKSINPEEWPFPVEKKDESKKMTSWSYRPTQYVHIDSDSLKNCWPNCVVMISMKFDSHALKGVYK
jgi:hypothetical protein